MQRKTTVLTRFIAAILALCAGSAAATDIQDLVRLKGHEHNMLTGLGLVVGLNGTGDKSKDAYIAAQPMAEMLANLGNGISRLEELAKADAFAIVLVTMEIPAAGAREGDRITINVESLFNAKSLAGGRLVPSMLRLPLPDSADLEPLALATGAISVEGTNPRSGVIRGGGQLLADFRANPIAENGSITLVLREPYAGYPVASVIAAAINEEFVPEGYPNIARVQDARNVRIMLPDAERANPANFIATVMTLPIDPSILRTPARVVINQRTGSIVITGNVEISPIAITHGGLSITTITPPPVATPADPVFGVRRWAMMNPGDDRSRASARLLDLVEGLEQLKIPTRDQIAILYQLKRAGALHAEIIEE